MYLLMGWLGLLIWDSLSHDPAQSLISQGGIFYSVGVVFFLIDHINFAPVMHAVWHIFVLAGALSHFVAIRSLVRHA